jgi:hypothetical protein
MLKEHAGANSAATIRFWQALKFTGALSSLCNAIPLQGTYVWLMLMMLKTSLSNVLREFYLSFHHINKTVWLTKLHITSWNSFQVNIAVTWQMRGLTVEIRKDIYVAE